MKRIGVSPVFGMMVMSAYGENSPAQVIWNRLSFSNFLKTLPLISTNWFDMRSERRALSYELIATFRQSS